MEKNLKITISGREYESVEAMPAGDRALYEKLEGLMGDTDGDGQPDVFDAFQQGEESDHPDLRELLGGMGPGTHAWTRTRITSTRNAGAPTRIRENISSSHPPGGSEGSMPHAMQGSARQGNRAGTVVQGGGSGWSRTSVVVSLLALGGIAWWWLRG